MRIFTVVTFLFLMSANLTSQTGARLVYQTRYESQDPNFHGPRGGDERTTTFRLADRMRTERERRPGFAFVSIVRCDLRRAYMLDMQSHQYSEVPLPTPEEIAQQRKARQEASTAEGEPNYVFEISIVDTGETKHAFGHTARRYMKTIKNIPGPEFHQSPQTTVEELWYLDVPPLGCDPEAISFGPGVHRGVGMVGDASMMKARPELRQTGELPRGLLLSSRKSGQEFRTSRSGEKTESIFYTINELVEFEEIPLDPSMFEIPAGFTKKETP